MQDIKEKLGKGYIHCRAVVEIVGKPKEHVDKTIKGYVEHIKKSKEFEVIGESFNEAKEMEGENKGFFSSFVEIEMLAKDIPALTAFCFDYMPSSIEIIEPQEMKIRAFELSNVMNDLQGKLHKIDMGAKQISSENKMLQKNAYYLATNLFMAISRLGAKKADEFAKLSGMTEENAKEFLEKLIKQDFMKKEGEEYILIKK